MYLSEWKEEDGYYESLISFTEGGQPIARLRAVRDGEGKYEAVVREYTGSGQIIATGFYKTTLTDACFQAVEKFCSLCRITNISTAMKSKIGG